MVDAMKLFEKTPEQGASTALVAALDPSLEGKEGAYLADCKEEELQGEGAKREGAVQQLWEISEALIGEKFVV